MRNIQADHPAFFQALVIRVSVRYSVPGLLPFAPFALFLSGLVWHYLDTLYSSSRTSTQVAPSLQYPIRTKPTRRRAISFSDIKRDLLG
ncbi:hypothetical protein PAMC26510_25080 [Caballeronia sordidicola]|uniref:Uncharacterized protein n=1 Tax=Caballeronia sordidicola TaxID=196367 RepID=A0A242MHP9_CABSO|nr:hypothetical protein PAMC26510_25080 [Caballeronia sordidicola]